MNEEKPTREFLKGAALGFLALLIGLAALIEGVLGLLGGLFPSRALELIVGIPSCLLGLFVGFLYFRGIARAFDNQSHPYRGMGLLSGILIPLLFVGLCAAVVAH